MNLEKVHEKETFTVLLKKDIKMSAVLHYLSERGYTQEDDFLYLLRNDIVEKWQTETLVTIDFEPNDRIEFSLLPASLPQKQWDRFFDELSSFGETFGEGTKHMEENFEMIEKSSIIERWSEEITHDCGDVSGSDSVAILIQMEYEK